MIACVDVGYSGRRGHAACVVIEQWRDASPAAEYVASVTCVEDYQPGEFYLRELPCILAVLNKLQQKPSCVVVDGYVWLDSSSRPGLGARLYEALNRNVPVVGVAKNPYKHSDHATPLMRGGSIRPLFITAVGLATAQAVLNIGGMHGASRMPTILRRVDQLSRQQRDGNSV